MKKNPSARSRAALPVLALMALMAALGLSGCDRDGEATAANTAEIATVERRDLEVKAEASGVLEAVRSVEVKSKASGEIQRLLVDTGSEVKRGDLLAEIDPRDVTNSLSQAQADNELARARVQTAAIQLRRARELHKAGLIPKQDLEAAQLEEVNSRAQLVKANTNYTLARQKMGDVTITAPMDGTVTAKTVEAGQIIASASGNVSGGTTLLTLSDLAEMQVRALVDETDIGRIAQGLTARVTVEAYPNRVFRGRVEKVEPQAVVEQNVTMFPVLVRLENPEGLLKPGMNADVEIDVARREDVTVVPNSAVVSMREAPAAAAVLGLDEDEVRTALRRRGGAGRDGGAAPAASGGAGRRSAGTDGDAAAPASADGTAAPGGAAGGGGGESGTGEAGSGRRGRSWRGQDGDTAAGSDSRAGGGTAAGAGAAGQAGRPAGAAGTDGQGEGQGGRRRWNGGGGSFGGGDSGGARPAVVFVSTPTGPEPRRVMLGLSDWDDSEVVRGLTPGERVYLLSVARLQQQQEQFNDRMRQRAGGGFLGGGTQGGGGGQGGGGQRGGSGGGGGGGGGRRGGGGS